MLPEKNAAHNTRNDNTTHRTVVNLPHIAFTLNAGISKRVHASEEI